ncbi:MAG TPA: hypothetical protein VJQ57_12135 [Acidimicrobiia bacterium]|nr:hypothetical protein [Acidimicrobiia bacterium]
MTFRPSSHRGARWLALLVLLLVTGMLASSAVAAPVFNFDDDDQGANDEPGQKDLTAQASAVDSASPNHFFTAWKWDDTSWSGNNTGDGCSLFDINDDGFVEYAACATVEGGKGPALVTFDTVTLYSCNNKWADRCGNPVIELGPSESSGYCTVTDSATGTFDSEDTQIACDITALAADADPPITNLVGGTLLNTCSYPSREPNSDPSDCVKTITNEDTSIATRPSGTTTWSATLNDAVTMSPLTATGSVQFQLWGVNTSGVCSNLIWTSASRTLASGLATAHDGDVSTAADAGSPADAYIITQATTDTDKVFYWTVEYSPTGAFNGSVSACGVETTTITPASLAHVPSS